MPKLSAAELNQGKEEPTENVAVEPRPFRQVLAYLAIYKLVYLLLIFVAIFIVPVPYNLHFYTMDYHIYSVPPPQIARYFVTWDAEHYLGISLYGYHSDPGNRAFYPLWPLVIHVGAWISRNPTLSGVVLANIIAIFALAGLHGYVQSKFSRTVADRTLLLMLAMPGMVFFSFPYTEPLFLGLAVLALWWLESDSYLLSGLAALLAALTRPVGVFFVVVYLFAAWSKRSWKPLIPALFPIAGFGIFLIVLAVQTGNPFGQFSAIANTGNGTSAANLVNIAAFVKAIGNVGAEHLYGDSPIDRLFFVWLIATLPAIFKRDKMLFGYAIAMGLLPAMATLFISYSRYVMMAFPMAVMTADYFAKSKREAGFAILLGALMMLQVFFLILHMNNYWAG